MVDFHHVFAISAQLIIVLTNEEQDGSVVPSIEQFQLFIQDGVEITFVAFVDDLVSNQSYQHGEQQTIRALSQSTVPAGLTVTCHKQGPSQVLYVIILSHSPVVLVVFIAEDDVQSGGPDFSIMEEQLLNINLRHNVSPSSIWVKP
jgi:hypothetical protein